MDTKISIEVDEKVGSTGLQEKHRRQRWGIEYLETGSVCSLFSTSTATMSNLPGAGRTLGNLYSKWGFALEESLGIFAHKRGFGPEAVADRISQNLQNRWMASYNGEASKEKFKRGIQKDCNKLIKHLRTGTPFTRMRAATRIIELSSTIPPVGYFMAQMDVLKSLDLLQVECLSSKDESYSRISVPYESVIMRNARLCLEANKATNSAWNLPGIKLFQEMDEQSEGDDCAWSIDKFDNGFRGLLEACSYPELRVLSLRYLYSVISHERPAVYRSYSTPFHTLYRRTLWTKLIDELDHQIACLTIAEDQELLTVLDQITSSALSWVLDSPTNSTADMSMLQYSPKWKTYEEANEYRDFVGSLLRLLTTLKLAKLRNSLPLAWRDAESLRTRIQTDVDWYVLYIVLGDEYFIHWEDHPDWKEFFLNFSQSRASSTLYTPSC